MEGPVHFYDTRLHGIPCGAKGPEVRSTKHARAVTCRSCQQALHGKPPVQEAHAAPPPIAPS
jgi:hypothetical protein